MVSNGQKANAATFNDAFLSRTVDSSTTGIVGLANLDVASGSAITNTQRAINKAFDSDGTLSETDTNAKVYSSTNYVVNGDSRKAAITRLDSALKLVSDRIPAAFGYFDLLNNTTANVTGLIFAPATVLTFEIEFSIYRKSTSVGANTKTQSGTFFATFNGTSWVSAYGPMTSEDGGVTFDVNNGTGQVTYTTDNQAGTFDQPNSYMAYRISKNVLLRV